MTNFDFEFDDTEPKNAGRYYRLEDFVRINLCSKLFKDGEFEPIHVIWHEFIHVGIEKCKPGLIADKHHFAIFFCAVDKYLCEEVL